MAFAAVSVLRGPGEIAAMVVQVTKRIFTRPFQFREFLEQAWFVTSVTLMPTILVSIPFGAVISLQVGNLTGQLGAQSFAGATAVLATVREAAPIAAALIISGAAGSAICSGIGGGYFFNVIVSGGSAGSFLSSFTALATLSDLFIAIIKAAIFGWLAGI